MSTPSDVFLAETETKNETNQKPPKCLVAMVPHIDSSRSSLSNEQWNEAEKSNIHKDFIKLEFPRTMKTLVDPPLNGQTYALVSFVPSPGAIPDEEGCYGIAKIRGTFSNMMEADSWSENIVRNCDSYAVVDFAYVGKPFPLMRDNTMYCSETKEIDIRRKIDTTTKAELKSKREKDQKDMREVQEREAELYKDIEDEKERTFDDLEFYTQVRAKKAQLMMAQEEADRKIKEASKILKKVNHELTELEDKHPEYKKQFLEKYKSALASIGAQPKDNPLIRFMGEEYTK